MRKGLGIILALGLVLTGCGQQSEQFGLEVNKDRKIVSIGNNDFTLGEVMYSQFIGSSDRYIDDFLRDEFIKKEIGMDEKGLKEKVDERVSMMDDLEGIELEKFSKSVEKGILIDGLIEVWEFDDNELNDIYEEEKLRVPFILMGDYEGVRKDLDNERFDGKGAVVNYSKLGHSINGVVLEEGMEELVDGMWIKSDKEQVIPMEELEEEIKRKLVYDKIYTIEWLDAMKEKYNFKQIN